jgi:hypothetical protein
MGIKNHSLRIERFNLISEIILIFWEDKWLGCPSFKTHVYILVDTDAQ